MEKFAPTIDDFDKRMFAITDSLYNFASIIKVTTAAIEAAIFIQNPRTTMQISSVVACAKYALYRASISVVPVDNRSWKKIILGKGNAGKPAIKQYAVDKWGDIFPEQDYADAACIALWAKEKD
tara:strand:- start:752 stop:1123 length:372 start_codon:yes stop_codon:yes gene_type:complete